MPKRGTEVILSEKEQEGLLQITKRHRSEQQVVLRARIVLAAAQGHANVQIASELGINVDTVRLWRGRWGGVQGSGLETLSLAPRAPGTPRPGGKARISSEQRCQMVALTWGAPTPTRR